MHEIPENELPDEPIPGDEQAAGGSPGRTPGNLPLSNEELVSAYLDGELQGPALARAERLLQERPEYRQLLEDMRGLRTALVALPRVELERDFYQQVLRRAEREMLSAPEEAVSEADPTLSATTLPAITLPLPQPHGPAAVRGARGACPPEVGKQPAQTDHGSSAAAASAPANTMPSSRGMPPTVSTLAGENAPEPRDQRVSAQQSSYALRGEEGGAAAKAPLFEVSAVPRARRLLSWVPAVLGALAALLILGLFLKSNWNKGELAQGPEAVRSISEGGLEINRLGGTKSGPGGATSFASEGRRELERGETAVPSPLAPAGEAALNAAPGTAVPEANVASGPASRRAARRQPPTLQDGLGRGSQVSPKEEETLGAAGARALVRFQSENGDDAAERAPPSGTLVVHCEVTPDGQSLQAFQQILQAADISCSESEAEQLERLLRKLASQLTEDAADPLDFAADEGAGERDKAPDAQSILQAPEQRAQQEKQLLAEVAPAFEVWYVVAAPQQVAAALEAMAQRPDIFRNASVLPGGIGSVPLAEWQVTYATTGRTEADESTAPLPDEEQSGGETTAKQDKHSPGTPVASGKGRPTRKSANAREDEAHDDGQLPPEEGGPAGEPVSSGSGDGAGESDEGSANHLEKLAESEPGSIVGEQWGGIPGGRAPQGGLDGGDLAKGYAVRWNMYAPDLAHALQQVLARLLSQAGDLPPGETAGSQPPAAPLPNAGEEASEPDSADTRERDALSEPDNAVEPSDAPREDMPTDAPVPGADDILRRKAPSNVAAGSDAEAERSRGRQGRNDRPGRAKKKPNGDAGREFHQGQAEGEEQAPSKPARQAAQTLPLPSAADAADRNTAAAPSGPGEPGFQDQDGERVTYRQVLFVLRLVPPEPAAAGRGD